MSSYPIMPNLGASADQTKEDSSKFKQTSVNNAVRDVTEGGYSINRARYKQPRKRLFETGFTNLTDNQKKIIENFEVSVNGTIDPFYWRNPQTKELILVQLVQPLSFVYSGSGKAKRWNIHDIKLREV